MEELHDHLIVPHNLLAEFPASERDFDVFAFPVRVEEIIGDVIFLL
jgi:hypothetical protein